MSKRIEHESNFTLEIKLREWHLPENSLTTVFNKTVLTTHPCTEEELGLDEARKDAKFYPMAASFQGDARRLINNWHCIDNPADLLMYGTFDSGEA